MTQKNSTRYLLPGKVSAWVMLLLVACLAVGCGPRIPPCYPATGMVKWKGGKKLTAGTVTFVSTSDDTIVADGNINADGTFTLTTKMFGLEKQGAPEGEYQVMVEDPTKNVATDGQLQIRPLAVSSTFQVQPRDGNEFVVEVEVAGQ